MQDYVYPMRINKYLAAKKIATRKGGDKLIEKGRVFINGKRAALGDKVVEKDLIEVRQRKQTYRYFAHYKPRGIITHSPQAKENDIASIIPIRGVFPIGRLDKDSCGLIILTDDGRIVDPLLSPNFGKEKEYEVHCAGKLPTSFRSKMEKGVNIGGYVTKPCTVKILGPSSFSIILSEGKKHQIRRMCGALGQSVTSLLRRRILNISIGTLRPGDCRAIDGVELDRFLLSLGF